eukprot:SAG11_NODE_36982_length_259_cov_0.625000_1_plen_81_part_10
MGDGAAIDRSALVHRGLHGDYFLLSGSPTDASSHDGADDSGEGRPPLVVVIGWLNSRREWRAGRAVGKAAEVMEMYGSHGC